MTGLDAGTARQVKNVLRERVSAGGTVIMTTHILEVAERMADRIGVIAGGRLIAEGTLDDLCRQTGKTATSLEDTFLALVAEEVAEYLLRRRAEAVAPTVVALRARAAEVVAAELARLEQRRPDLDPEVREELRRTVNRVVDKLLHAPTVRVKELSGVAEPADYAAALRDLFDLDPHEVAAVSLARLDTVIDLGGSR